MPIAVTVVGLSLSKVLRDLGYAGLALLMLAETVFPPIPSEAVLPLAGYLVERGEFSYVFVLLASTQGRCWARWCSTRRRATAGGRSRSGSCASRTCSRTSSTTRTAG